MTNYKINKQTTKIIKTIIIMGIFAVLPLVAADVRIDRVFAIQYQHQHDEDYDHPLKPINYFEDLLKNHYYSSMFIRSAWSNWSENIRKLLALVKGEDAVKLAKSLNDEAILSFAEVTDDKTGEIVIEIYDTSLKIKKEKEPVISF